MTDHQCPHEASRIVHEFTAIATAWISKAMIQKPEKALAIRELQLQMVIGEWFVDKGPLLYSKHCEELVRCWIDNGDIYGGTRAEVISAATDIVRYNAALGISCESGELMAAFLNHEFMGQGLVEDVEACPEMDEMISDTAASMARVRAKLIQEQILGGTAIDA